MIVLARSSGVRWDGRTLGPWAAALNGADALINLAGRSVDCRYTAGNRREIMDSRLESTAVLREAILQADVPPRVWLQSSTATIYADTYGPPNAEDGALGADGMPDTWRFSYDVARRWEEAAADTPVRTVLMRSAMVMSPDRGGVFDTLRTLVRRGLGGPAAGGRQYVSWIHDVDFAAAIRLLIERDDLSGPVNLAAPNPLPYRGLHGRAAARRGRPVRAARDEVDARVGRVRDAHRDRARPEVASRRAGRADRRGLRVQLPGVAGGGPGSRGTAASVVAPETARISPGSPSRSTFRTSVSGWSSGAKKLS